MVTDIYELEEGATLELQFKKRNGFLPVAVQEILTGKVLMIASINKEAFQETLKTGLATFWSTSRNELWTKGKTSGDYLVVHKILVDCDQDALVFQVELKGNGVCHTIGTSGKNRKACFYRYIEPKNKKLVFIEEMQ